MGLSCPLGIDRFVSAILVYSFGHIINPSFIDQACSVKIAEYWPRSFLRFLDREEDLVHKNEKKNLANIQPS